jgi:flavodoxin
MNALVVFDTQYGNTEQVAHAIALGLAPAFSVQLAKADQIAKIDAERLDLLIVGGPTHRHRISEPLAAMLEAIPRKTLKGIKVAAFDTRYHMAAWLTGSAARGIARDLRKLGGRLVVPAQSFFMERDVPPKGEKRRHELEHLEPGEIERATLWAVEIARAAASE